LPAGLCDAAIQALKTPLESVQGKILHTLAGIIPQLSGHCLHAAMDTLVAGDVVEFTVGHIARAGPDMLGCGILLFRLFLTAPQGRERMCRPETVQLLMQWLVTWLQEVCHVLLEVVSE
jgi:hypothetical protein